KHTIPHNPAFLQSVPASNRCYPAHFFVGQNDQSQSNPVQCRNTVHVRFRPSKRDVAGEDQDIYRKDYISDRSPHREQLSDGGSVDEVNQKNDSARPKVHSLPLIGNLNLLRLRATALAFAPLISLDASLAHSVGRPLLSGRKSQRRILTGMGSRCG